MSKELLVNQTHNEVRIALLDNGSIIDFHVDRGQINDENRPRVGNIYMGKVLRVLPGMQSAFVDIGFDRAAFLYVDDAYLPSLEEQREMTEKMKASAEKERREQMGEVIPDEFSTLSESMDMRFKPDISIEQFLKEGDTIMVQIAKEAISTKGPRVTRQITLAGRYIVFMPFIEHLGVSRRIENEKERDRLKEMLEGIRKEGQGIIARTVAEGQNQKTLNADFHMLVKMWKEISKKSEKMKAPNCAHSDLKFVERVLRDITDEDVDKVVVDTKENLKTVDKFVNRYLPTIKGKTKFHQEITPIFEHFGIEIEVQRGLSNKVYLKSGGSINVDQTEALVSIDVNTGKFVGRRTLEETILQTNLEAVKEIAYQLRLRNCGGIIIIDFIDMEKPEHRDTVYQSLLEALKKDRSKTNVLPISGLGLVEMTRKRTRDTLTRIMCDTCAYCEGTGKVKSVLTVSYEIIRELSKYIKKNDGKKFFVYATPEVSDQLCRDDLGIIDTLEESFQVSIVIRSENSYHIEQYEICSQEF